MTGLYLFIRTYEYTDDGEDEDDIILPCFLLLSYLLKQIIYDISIAIK